MFDSERNKQQQRVLCNEIRRLPNETIKQIKSLKYSIFTKRTQTLKANHLSKNGVIIADDTDIVFPNVDKNSKTIKINLKNIKNQINHSINT